MDETAIIPVKAFSAFIFDLDGVVTDTAKIHAAAWKKTFDGFLKKQAADGTVFAPFDLSLDYTQYVDGMPRYDGVRNFLESRGIRIPYGTPADSPDQDTIYGIGNRKNAEFQRFIENGNILVYGTTLELIRTLRSRNIKTAVVSSSKNCLKILEAVHIVDLFDTRIDGIDSQKLNLKGKPDPDIFLTAARKLNVSPDRAVVVEDAISGVIAGKKGGFGLVIGIDRASQSEKLKEHGADVVVRDLAQVSLA